MIMKFIKKTISVFLAILSLTLTPDFLFAANAMNTSEVTEESSTNNFNENTNEEERGSEVCETKNTSEISETIPDIAIQNKSSQEISLASAIDEFTAEYLDGLKNHDEETINVPPYMIEKTINAINEVIIRDEVTQENEVLVNVDGNIIIVGDTHGQFDCSYLIIKTFLRRLRSNFNEKILFLGDYVDRGDESVKNFIVICALKVKFPNNVYMLRGNHEDICQNENDGLFQEFDEKYSNCGGSAILSQKFETVYERLPLCAILNGKVYCAHGGIPYPSDDPNYYQSEDCFYDVLWSDPYIEGVMQPDGFDEKGYKINHLRGYIGRIFNKIAVENFLAKKNVNLIIRAHQALTLSQSNDLCKTYGYKLISVYSADNHISFMSIKDEIDLSENMITKGFVIIYDQTKHKCLYEQIDWLPVNYN